MTRLLSNNLIVIKVMLCCQIVIVVKMTHLLSNNPFVVKVMLVLSNSNYSQNDTFAVKITYIMYLRRELLDPCTCSVLARAYVLVSACVL